MQHQDLAQYWSRVIKGKDAEAKTIHPSSVVTAPWVRMKCQFGCVGYGKGYCCPPNTPTHAETRQMLDSYHRGILFHLEAAKRPRQSRAKMFDEFRESLVELEGEMFKDGFYKAFVLLAGPCGLCKECAILEGSPCKHRSRARPSMEACGIDVYQTARNNGFPLKPLREKGETQNNYCLLLVD